jgi:hypothetical protein
MKPAAIALACLLFAACDHGWFYHLAGGGALAAAPDEEARRRFYRLDLHEVEYQLECLFFVAGLTITSEVHNRGTSPLAFFLRKVELRDSEGQAIPMDAVFEGGEMNTGFYARANRGEEFHTGVKIIPPGQSYRIAHRFGQVSGLEGGFAGFGSHVNPKIRTVTFVNTGLEAGGRAIPVTVTFESDFVR